MIFIKWKVIKNNSYEDIKGDLLNTLLINRGVEDIDGLLNVGTHNLHHWSLLKNIKEAIQCLKKHIDRGSTIVIRVDPDCDGYTSFTELYCYLKKNFGVECIFVTSSEKTHGIFLEELEGIHFDLLIMPDGGSFDYEQHCELIKQGKDVLVVDHHQPEAEDEENEKVSKCMLHDEENIGEVIVVNPQLDDYPNKTLSGAGVVHKFCEALDETFGFNDSENYLDLVALGLIGDRMDLRNLETRYYVLKGIELMREDFQRKLQGKEIRGNLFIQEMIFSKKDDKLKHINIDSLSWNVIPLINGMARAGSMEEKIDTFKALIGEEKEIWCQPRRKKKEDPKPDLVLRTLQEDMVRVCTNAKSRQDKAKSKIVGKIQSTVEEKMMNDKVLIIDETEDMKSGALMGLLANGLVTKYKKPTLVIKKDENGMYRGSARDYEKSPIEDFNQFLTSTGHFEYCRGHSGAFGLAIKEEEISKLKVTLNELLKDVPMEEIYLVDYQIPIGRLKQDQVINVGKLKDFWGNTLHKPLFAITDLIMETKDIELIGERSNVLKFRKNDITFIKFYANEDLLNELKMKEKSGFKKSPTHVRLEIIGEFHADEYEGRLYPSIHIVDFNVYKKEDMIF